MIPLPERLAELVTSLGWTFGGFERRRWNSIRVVFGRGMDYWYVDATAPGLRSRYRSADDLDAELYRRASRAIRRKIRALKAARS